MNGMIDWDLFDLVVFDMDGTLYDQRPLRRRMAARLAAEALRTRSVAVPRMLRRFRHHREALAGRTDIDFAKEQYALTGYDPAMVRAAVADWMENRPLPFLGAYRARGVDSLFSRLSRRHVVAVHSDYPATRKLAALGLTARYVVAAEDVGQLKPDPAGLRWLMAASGTDASRTLMIGDRDDRDGEAARRAGVRALIRGRDFHHFDEAIFAHAA